MFSSNKNKLEWLHPKDKAAYFALSKRVAKQFVESNRIDSNSSIVYTQYAKQHPHKHPFGEYIGDYYALKDYLLLSQLRIDYANSATVDMQRMVKMTKHLVLSAMLKTAGQVHESISESKTEEKSADGSEYQEVLSHYFMSRNYKEEHVRLFEKLKQCGSSDPAEDLKKISDLLYDHTDIVVSFDLDKFTTFRNQRLLNYFQANKKTNEEYFYNRLATEILYYLDLKTQKLLKLLLEPGRHPCFGTLQFSRQISPIEEYGSSFLVLDRSIKSNATAIFGDQFDVFKTKTKAAPSHLSVQPVGLISQLSDPLLKSLLAADEESPFPKDYVMEYKNHRASYIEVHFPANLRLDQDDVKHIHWQFPNNMSSLAEIDYLFNRGITVSLGTNPFLSAKYANAHQAGSIESYYINAITDTLHEAISLMTETTTDSDDPLFILNETSLDLTLEERSVHPAQFCGALHLFGVRKKFEDTSAFQALNGWAEQKDSSYVLPLNNTSKQEGGLDDHDAYSHTVASLRQLLQVFLKRIFTVILSSAQNEQHLLTKNTFHPFTGKGPTHAVNQVRELKLGDEAHPYEIKVHWFISSYCIEILSDDSKTIDFCFEILSAYFPSLIREKNFFLIDLHTINPLRILARNQFPYQATVIYEDKIDSPQYGDVCLAFRHGAGWATPGGHNNYPDFKPMPWVGVFADVEFAQRNCSWAELKENLEPLGSSHTPNTTYFALRKSLLRDFQADEHEFINGSLRWFPIYQLGCLQSEQVAFSASMLGITAQDYTARFGARLVLRPVQSLLIYLQHCENELNSLLKSNFSLYPAEDFSVTVHRRVEACDHYWLPEAAFGQVSLNGKPHCLSLIKQYVEQHYPGSCEQTSQLRFHAFSPKKLISLLQSFPKELKTLDWFKQVLASTRPDIYFSLNFLDKMAVELNEAASAKQIDKVNYLLDHFPMFYNNPGLGNISALLDSDRQAYIETSKKVEQNSKFNQEMMKQQPIVKSLQQATRQDYLSVVSEAKLVAEKLVPEAKSPEFIKLFAAVSEYQEKAWLANYTCKYLSAKHTRPKPNQRRYAALQNIGLFAKFNPQTNAELQRSAAHDTKKVFASKVLGALKSLY